MGRFDPRVPTNARALDLETERMPAELKPCRLARRRAPRAPLDVPPAASTHAPRVVRWEGSRHSAERAVRAEPRAEVFARALVARPTVPKRERRKERARQRRGRWPTVAVRTSRALRASVTSTLAHRTHRCTPRSALEDARRANARHAVAHLAGGTMNGTTCSRPSKPERYAAAACWLVNGPIRTRYHVPRPGTLASTT